MKRRERALIIFPVLVLIWGTMLSGPFRYFAWMSRDLGSFIFGKLGVGSDLTILFSYLLSIIVMIILCLIWRGGNRRSIPAICTIASVVFFFVKSSFSDSVPIYIAIGLVLTLLVYAFDARVLEEWLADLFILGIPVMIIYDTLLVPIFAYFNLNTKLFYPWVDIPDTSLIMNLSLLNIPVMVWGLILTIITTGLAIYFVSSDSRRKQVK